MNIRYKRLNDLAKVPTRGSEYAAGYDLYAATDREISLFPHTTQLIGVGLAFELPDGYFGAVYARSGLASKKGLRPANCVGVVDSDYRGEVMVALYNDSGFDQEIKVGDRIAQFILEERTCVEWEVTDTLDETERSSGGFGSTGLQ
jgi:dUTP pyrophosphatase